MLRGISQYSKLSKACRFTPGINNPNDKSAISDNFRILVKEINSQLTESKKKLFEYNSPNTLAEKLKPDLNFYELENRILNRKLSLLSKNRTTIARKAINKPSHKKKNSELPDKIPFVPVEELEGELRTKVTTPNFGEKKFLFPGSRRSTEKNEKKGSKRTKRSTSEEKPEEFGVIEEDEKPNVREGVEVELEAMFED